MTALARYISRLIHGHTSRDMAEYIDVTMFRIGTTTIIVGPDLIRLRLGREAANRP